VSLKSSKKFELLPAGLTLIKAFAKGKRFFCGNRLSSLEFVDATAYSAILIIFKSGLRLYSLIN